MFFFSILDSEGPGLVPDLRLEDPVPKVQFDKKVALIEDYVVTALGRQSRGPLPRVQFVAREKVGLGRGT